MGFLKKLFRRKKTVSNGSSTTEGSVPLPGAPPSTRKSRRDAKRQAKQSGLGSNGNYNRNASAARDDSPTAASATENAGVVFIPPSSSSRNSFPGRGPDLSDGTQRPILSPRTNGVLAPASASSGHQYHHPHSSDYPGASMPVDLDNSVSNSLSRSNSQRSSISEEKKNEREDSMELDDGAKKSSPASSNNHHRPVFTMPDSHHSTSINGMGGSGTSPPKFTMPDSQLPKLRFSAGNVSVDDGDNTDGESSSFNLSTDAEDTEYETMRRRLGAITAADTSVTNYTTDGETSVFPGLPSEDELTTATASVTKEASHNSILNIPVTVNPATGASLVPYGTDYPDDDRVDIPAMYRNNSRTANGNTHHQHHSLYNSLTKNNKTSGGGGGSPNIMTKSKAALNKYSSTSNSNNNNGSSSSNNNSGSNNISLSRGTSDSSGSNHKNVNTSSRGQASRIDSPDRKKPRSPKESNNVPTDFKSLQYNSNFMEAVYGSPDKPRRSFTSPKMRSEPSFEPSFPSSTAAEHDRFSSSGKSGLSTSMAAQTFQAKVRAPTFSTRDSAEVRDDFANFADFSNFGSQDPFSSSSASAARSTMEADSQQQQIYIETDNMKARNSASRRSASSSGLAANNDTSLSELLAQAKSKSSSRNSGRKASSSVNSAPAITAAYLRQHHNLKSRNRDEASVTDIIKNLEDTNASRGVGGGGESSSRSVGASSRNQQHPHHRGPSDANSTNSQTSVSKEKLRRRRERRNNRSSNGEYSSDSEPENEDSESWLFDEVTGALGPRGIAADLESLSGRSNRSSSSRGGRSHKSHRSHRSHKSRSSRSNRRQHKSGSGESVDSRHSRDSRRSRSSRYSHRSARSYISQMSEQSRSVANDLLRLEMQLAMVGSNVGGGGGAGPAAADDRASIVSGRSRVSRTSTGGASSSRRAAAARRSRVTVAAPPGKLGIILANKADSKGTVVSGVRTSSALADKITPGDRIVAIDGEDVSLMTVSEITTIMARKSDFERTLTVLTTPRHTDPSSASSVAASTSTANNYHHHAAAAATTTGSVSNSLGSPRNGIDVAYQHRAYRA